MFEMLLKSVKLHYTLNSRQLSKDFHYILMTNLGYRQNESNLPIIMKVTYKIILKIERTYLNWKNLYTVTTLVEPTTNVTRLQLQLPFFGFLICIFILLESTQVLVIIIVISSIFPSVPAPREKSSRGTLPIGLRKTCTKKT